MSLSLAKNEKLSLTKSAPQLRNALIGLGWDVRATSGADFDLDASALLLKADPSRPSGWSVRSDNDLVFYNQLTDNASNPSVTHYGDNRDGSGDGDDEKILINLDKVPADVGRVMILVTIHDANSHNQNFGQVHEAFVRLVDNDTDKEIVKYDLAESASTDIGLKFVSLDREPGGWVFNAVGQGTTSDFATLLREFGVNV